MKQVEFSGTVEEYQGKKLAKPIEFAGTATTYENVAEAKTSEDWPGDSEVLKMVNAKRITSAKAQKYQESTKSLKEAYEASDDFKRANLIKAAVNAGFSQAEAEALAASKIG